MLWQDETKAEKLCIFPKIFECILVSVIMKRKIRKQNVTSFFFVFWKSIFHTFDEFHYVLRDIEKTILPVLFQIFNRYIILSKSFGLNSKNSLAETN